MHKFQMVRAYLSALWADLVARLSGLASVVLTFATGYSDYFSGLLGVAHVRTFLGITGVGSFLFANYRLWAKEHQQVLSQKPNFKVFLEHIDWEYHAPTNETVLVIAVNLSNSGAPSAAIGWRGTLIVGGHREPLTGINVTRGWVLNDPAKKNPIIILPEHLISYKTRLGRIETGEIILGRSFLTTPGNRELFLNSLNWGVELTCDDVFGNSFTGAFEPHPGLVPARKSFPGELPFTPENLALIGGNNEV